MDLKYSDDGFYYEEKIINTGKQVAKILEFYDWKYNIKLSYDKNNRKVKAEIYNYLNEFQDNYNGDITFEYEGNELTVQAVNGVAEIDFIADEGLECTVRTKNEKFRNGEVTFIA